MELKSLKSIVERGLPDAVLPFFFGIGDQMFLTTVAREIKKRKPSLRIWQITRYPDLFWGNPDFDVVLPCRVLPPYIPHIVRRDTLRLGYSRFIETDQEEPPSEHILTLLCRQAEIKGEIDLRPYLYLSTEESQQGRFSEHQIAINVVWEYSYENVALNKTWPMEHFQEVVNELVASGIFGRKYVVIQVGMYTDPLIRGCIDLRGKTTLRQTAAILSQSDVCIGTVNGVTHMARAVDCPAVVIYGGRESSWQSGYNCNENMQSQVECAPCWKASSCSYERKCMRMITSKQVLEALEKIIAQESRPLCVEKKII
jgi:ADP-heptose:LPS heptosyltransferase